MGKNLTLFTPEIKKAAQKRAFYWRDRSNLGISIITSIGTHIQSFQSLVDFCK